MSTRRRRRSQGFAVLLSSVLVSAVLADTAEGPVSPAVGPISQSILLDYLAGKQNFTLIDARSVEEFEVGHILRAVNVPHDAIEAHADKLPDDKSAPLVTYCRSGKRARALERELAAMGYKNVRVLGPEQIVWADTAPMFNCGASAPGAASEPEFVPASPTPAQKQH